MTDAGPSHCSIPGHTIHPAQLDNVEGRTDLKKKVITIVRIMVYLRLHLVESFMDELSKMLYQMYGDLRSFLITY